MDVEELRAFCTAARARLDDTIGWTFDTAYAPVLEDAGTLLDTVPALIAQLDAYAALEGAAQAVLPSPSWGRMTHELVALRKALAAVRAAKGQHASGRETGEGRDG